MFRKLKTVGLSFLGTIALYGQQNTRMRGISESMQRVNSDVTSTIATVRYWVYGLISLMIVIKMVQILMGNDRGDEKMLKIGALFGVLTLGAIIVYVAESVFG